MLHMDVDILPAAIDELRALPVAERKAMVNVLEKLRIFGTQLPYPHSSQVKSTQLRELRPRAGRSPWRALYQQVGMRIVVLAIVPEAMYDSRGFERGLREALDRMKQ
jgi:phage-related protein